MNAPLPPQHVVVVGGGLSGLAAALYLARSGSRVTLFERSQHVGGRGRSPELGGVPVNLGGHAIYKTGPAARVLRELGLTLDGGTPPKRGLINVDDELQPLPFSPWSILRSPLLRGRRFEFARFMTRITGQRLDELPESSWAAYVSDAGVGPAVQALAWAFARLTTYVDSPETLPARVVVRQLQRATKGVTYLHGGWQTLARGLEAACEQAGVTIERGVSVRSVGQTAGVIDGASTADGFLRASAVVLATAPVVASELVPASAALRDWARAARRARLACLDAVLEPGARGKSYFLMGLDEPIHVINHSAVARFGDATVVHAHRYLPLDEPRREEGTRDAIRRMIGTLFPEWETQVRDTRFLARMVAMEDAPEVGRARASARVPDVQGLSVCGDWVGDDILLDAALASAREAAELARTPLTMTSLPGSA